MRAGATVNGKSWSLAVALRCAAVVAAACFTPLVPAQGLPAQPPGHVVIVIMENHASSQIMGSPDAPYINRLAKEGAYFAQSFAVAHPSQPNYLALFSGSTHGVKSDTCPLNLAGPNLGAQLIAAGLSFTAYSEALPSPGYAGCTAAGGYARKHAPWANFKALPPATHQPFTAFPRADFGSLPTVAFVVPTLGHDMHDGTVAQGDAWLASEIDGYVQWSKTHNGLLILTWDEDDNHQGNQIPTIFVGPMVKPGIVDRRITHYDVLRTVEAMYKLPYAGKAASAVTITEPW